MKNQNRRKPPTSYDQQIQVVRNVNGIPVKLLLQERTSLSTNTSWWVLSWRTRYSPSGPNRRFYFTKDGCWIIPAVIALEMIEEMEAQGAFEEKYFDHRSAEPLKTLNSMEMTLVEKSNALEGVTGPDEDWGRDPLLVINSDPNKLWKKVFIVDTDTNSATFRSITEDSDYKPKMSLRRDAGWWLDNSMMDANAQQMKAFHSHLQNYIAGR